MAHRVIHLTHGEVVVLASILLDETYYIGDIRDAARWISDGDEVASAVIADLLLIARVCGSCKKWTELGQFLRGGKFCNRCLKASAVKLDSGPAIELPLTTGDRDFFRACGIAP